MSDLRRQRNSPGSAECLRKSSQHREVGVKRNPLQPTDPERRRCSYQQAYRPTPSTSRPSMSHPTEASSARMPIAKTRYRRFAAPSTMRDSAPAREKATESQKPVVSAAYTSLHIMEAHTLFRQTLLGRARTPARTDLPRHLRNRPNSRKGKTGD